MKQVLLLMLCALLIGLGGSFVYADRDTAGSSTDTSRLKGLGNVGRSEFTNVHSGGQVFAANQVFLTDAGNPEDSHPLEPGS